MGGELFGREEGLPEPHGVKSEWVPLLIPHL